jgi:hypothetical protein
MASQGEGQEDAAKGWTSKRERVLLNSGIPATVHHLLGSHLNRLCFPLQGNCSPLHLPPASVLPEESADLVTLKPRTLGLRRTQEGQLLPQVQCLEERGCHPMDPESRQAGTRRSLAHFVTHCAPQGHQPHIAQPARPPIPGSAHQAVHSSSRQHERALLSSNDHGAHPAMTGTRWAASAPTLHRAAPPLAPLHPPSTHALLPSPSSRGAQEGARIVVTYFPLFTGGKWETWESVWKNNFFLLHVLRTTMGWEVGEMNCSNNCVRTWRSDMFSRWI